MLNLSTDIAGGLCGIHSPSVMDQVLDALREDDYWYRYVVENMCNIPRVTALHLAIFVEPFLGYILEGKKTVESRFSSNECPPFGVAREGDIVLLKKAGGSICGISMLSKVWHYRIAEGDLQLLRTRFGDAMCAGGDEFWVARQKATCASLMLLANTRPIVGVNVDKRDRRGWVVLRERSQQLLLWDE